MSKFLGKLEQKLDEAVGLPPEQISAVKAAKRHKQLTIRKDREQLKNLRASNRAKERSDIDNLGESTLEHRLMNRLNTAITNIEQDSCSK